MKKISFNVVIKSNGEWKFRKGIREEVFKTFGYKDCDVVVEMCFVGKPKLRSLDQNNYYWGVVVPIVCAGFIMSGSDLRIDRNSDLMIVHEVLKDKFIPEGEMVLFDKNGNTYGVKEKSTTALSTVAANKYFKDIGDWCFNSFFLRIPLPGEDMEYMEDDELIKVKVEEFIRIIKDKYESR